MNFRVKEICKERGLTMAELAKKLKITPVSLSQCLAGNPSMSRLEEIARILDVEVVDLFDLPRQKGIQGCVFVDGEPHIIQSYDSLIALIEELDK